MTRTGDTGSPPAAPAVSPTAAAVDPDLLATPIRLLDDLPLGALHGQQTLTEVLGAAGFTIHYNMPTTPGTGFGTYAEVIAEHAASGVWVARCMQTRETLRHTSEAVKLLEAFLGTPPAAGSLLSLTQTLAQVASVIDDGRVGGDWVEGGLLLGCLRVLDAPSLAAPDTATGSGADVRRPAPGDVARTLIALLDSDLLPRLDRLACWQDAVRDQRTLNEDAARDAYYEAVFALWPALGTWAELAADEISRAVKPAHLLSHPRDDWPTAAPQILLDMLARYEKWTTQHLDYAWGKAGLGLFTVSAALDAAAESIASRPIASRSLAGVTVPAPSLT